MGILNSKPDREIEVQPSLPGYMYPEPPETCVDDIRPLISWYQDDTSDEEFNWSDLDNDEAFIEENLTSIPSARSAPAAPDRTPTAGKRSISSLTRPLTSRPITTPSGRGRSLYYQERTRSVTKNRGSSLISAGTLPLHGFHSRQAPQIERISFSVVDDHARKRWYVIPRDWLISVYIIQAGRPHMQTYTALIDYLTQPVRYHKLRELLTARAIIIWLAYQTIRTSLITQANVDTPKGLLQLLAKHRISYSGAYTILCRHAGLQCVLVDGVSKQQSYEPGDAITDALEDIWTAVYVQDGWQLVHPFWICKGLYGNGGSIDDWISRETEDGKQKRSDVIKKLKLLMKNFVNEDYFMPAPEVFIHTCYADETKWQLLPPELCIRSREEFMSLPCIYPAFFRLGLRLMSETNCVLQSHGGMCKIGIVCERNTAHRLNLTYELSLMETTHESTDILFPNMHRLVANIRHNRWFHFEIRFPIEGTFKLEIQGGYHNSHSMRLCRFRIVCRKRYSYFRYYPSYPDTLMWGPGPVCDEAGLLLPSKPTGTVMLYPNRKSPLINALNEPVTYQKRTFNFLLHPDIKRNTEYTVLLVGRLLEDEGDEVTPLEADGQLKNLNRKRRKLKKVEVEPQKPDYSHCVRCVIDQENQQLDIEATVPHEGEFALIVKARGYTVLKNRTKVYNEERPVCYYLLRTADEAHRETVHQKLARAELQTVTKGNAKEAIRKAIDKCLRVSIDNSDDDVAAGETKWEYLMFKKELNDAIHRRNLRIANEKLQMVSQYRHRTALMFQIRLLFKLRKQLKLLWEFRQDIPTLRDAGYELAQMVDPPSEVHITLGAVLLLLEEQEKYLDNWDYIVHQLVSPPGGHTDPPITKKMYLIAEVYPSKNTKRKINALLSEFDVEKVNRVSPAAAKFYFWVQKVMAVLQDVDFNFDYQLEPDIEKQGVIKEDDALLEHNESL